MAIRQNIGAGGLYPTGIAPQAMDFTQTQQALSQALISQKKEEIKQKKDLMSESEKAMLEAMSFESVQGLSEQAQLDHLKRYEDLSSRWTKAYKEGSGILSNPQMFQMQKEKRKLDIETSNMKYRIAQVQKAQQEYNTHPLNYDPQSVANLKNIFDKGLQGLVDASNVLVPRQVAWTEYVDNQYKPELTSIGKQANTAISMAKSRQGIVEALKDNSRRIGELYDTAAKTTPNILRDRSGQPVSKEEFINTYKTQYSTESFNASLDRTNRAGSGSGLAKKQELYPTQVGDETIFNLPNTMGQSVKKYKVGSAIDPKTGEEVVINDAIDVEPIGFTSDGMIIGEVGGGQLKRGDKPLFSTSKDIDSASLEDKKQEDTEDDLKKRALAIFEGKAGKPSKAGVWSNTENVKLEKDEDGNYVLKGTINAYEKGIFGRDVKPGDPIKSNYTKAESKEVEVPVYPVIDQAGKRQLKFPLKDYRNLVAGQEKSYRIGDKTVGQYLDDVQDGLIQSQSKQSKPEIVEQDGVTYKLNKQTGEYEPI